MSSGPDARNGMSSSWPRDIAGWAKTLAVLRKANQFVGLDLVRSAV
jgi:hypothetical protein